MFHELPLGLQAGGLRGYQAMKDAGLPEPESNQEAKPSKTPVLVEHRAAASK